MCIYRANKLSNFSTIPNINENKMKGHGQHETSCLLFNLLFQGSYEKAQTYDRVLFV